MVITLSKICSLNKSVLSKISKNERGTLFFNNIKIKHVI